MTQLVSVCVPTYNGEKYLRESLECIVSQTYENLEILIVDDQSTDQSLAIAQEFQQKDNRFRLIRNSKNLGLVGNWNKCIDEAKGKWIKLHFQDDLMSSEAVDELMENALQHNVGLVLTDRDYFFENEENDFFSKKLKRLSHFFAERTLITPKLMAKLLIDVGIHQNFIGEPILGLLNKELANKYGLYDEKFKQLVDFEFWLRISLNENIGFINKKLHQFRVHDQSESARNLRSKGVNVSVLDRINLLSKLQTHASFNKLKDLIDSEQLNEMATRHITKYVAKHGYFRIKRRVEREALQFFDGKILSWIKALFFDFWKGIGLK